MRNIAKRHNYILEELKRDGYVKVQDLSLKLGVSEVTIRKDLKFLESRKMLSRNHGSANSLIPIIADRHIDIKEKMQIEEKSRIGKAANSLLEPNDKIIIGSGTTLLHFASSIDTDIPLTIITPSVKVSLSLCHYPNIEIIQLGGVIRKNSVSVIGHYAEETLHGISCNKLFIGIDGLDLDYGLTTSNMSEAHINHEMINVSQKIIVLADSSKFGKRGFCKICDWSRVHHIITDTNASPHMVEMMMEKGIEVTLV